MNDRAILPPQPTQPFASRSEHQAAIGALLASTQRELRVFDQNCAGLGFNTADRFEALRQFLLGSRANRMFIVVHDTGYLAAHCPRMMLLMKQFGHAVFVQKTRKELRNLHDNFMVADDSAYLRQFHCEHPRGILGIDNPSETQALLMRFNEIWENSTPGLAATTLGL
jgi:hypothetical protein